MSTVSKLVADLKQCTSLEIGKKLHSDAVAVRCHTNKYVAAALITMYGKCNDMFSARKVFDGTLHRDVVIWTSLILGYVDNGECTVAMDVFSSIDCYPTFVTFLAALKACGRLAAEKGFDKHFCLEKAINIHKEIKRRSIDTFVNVVSTLVDVYSRCGSISHAKAVFDAANTRNNVTWTALILGYVENGETSAALYLFSCMNCEPDSFTYVAALKGLVCDKSLGKEFCLEQGITLHKRAQDGQVDEDIVVATTLLSMYSKCGSLKHATQVFGKMIRRDVVAWTSLISGYVENGESTAAVDVFTTMDCQPSFVTYVSVLKACGGLVDSSHECFGLEKGISIHKQVLKHGFHSNIIVANTLLDMYNKCRSMRHSCGVFHTMNHRDVITWNTLIRGHVENGECMAALELFSVMDCNPDSFTYAAVLKACVEMSMRLSQKIFSLEKGISIHKKMQDSNVVVDGPLENALLDMYCKCGSIRHAEVVFNGMFQKDVIAWNILIQGCAENGESSLALELFTEMGCQAHYITFMAALKACGSLASLASGLRIHARVCKAELEQETTVSTALMHLYIKCGCMSRAEMMFNDLHSPDVISWTILIAGYCFLGDSAQVSSTTHKMQEAGVQMDEVTLTCLLTSCNHTGLVEQGKQYLKAFVRPDMCLNVEHYNCMIDMLGRANRLPEALQLIRDMPIDADPVTWITLLGACKQWKNLEVGKEAFHALV